MVNKGELTEEEANLINTGIRPEDMDYKLFSFYRKMANKFNKVKLKGRKVFTSVDYIEQPDKTYKRVTYTYINKDKHLKKKYLRRAKV